MPHSGPPSSPSRDLNFSNMAQTFTIPTRQHSHHGHVPHAHAAPHLHAVASSSISQRTGSMDRLRRERDEPAPRHGRSSFSVPPSAQSSASGSKSSSFIGTPRLLSRRGSARDSQRPSVGRSDSIKRATDDDQSEPSGGRSPDDQEQV